MKRLIINTTLMTFVVFSWGQISYALSVETHQAFNEHIAQTTLNGFSLDDYLKNRLGFSSGIKEKFNNSLVWESLRDGGLYEDLPPQAAPYFRSVNHFHNPLKSINDAGFTGIWGSGVLHGKSALLWSQSAPDTQYPGGSFSWNDVRNYYYEALKSPDKSNRNTSFANTFRDRMGSDLTN